MTKRQLIACVFALITVVSLAGIWSWTAQQRYDKEAEINAQTEIERIKIEAERDLKRTKERMNWVPWYKGGENKDEE